MNWFDIVIIALIGVFALFGWRKGVLQVVVVVAGFVAGLLIANSAYKPVATAISPVIESENTALVVSFALIFLSIVVASIALGKLLKKTLNLFLLGWLDNAAGLGFGGLVGALIATSLIVVMGTLPISTLNNTVTESTLALGLIDKMRLLLELLPDEFNQLKELL